MVFASDYDGTLYKNKEITEYDLKMIDKFREQGNLFGIATGRSIDSIVYEIDKYKIPFDFIIGINGGVVLDSQKEELFVSSLNQDIIPSVMKTLEEEKIRYYGLNDGYGRSRVTVTEEDTETEFNEELSNVDDLLKNGVKAMFISSQSPDHAYYIANKLNDLYSDSGVQAFPNTRSVDLGVKGINKATGIEQILNNYKLHHKTPIYTVGDAYNDVPMLKDFHGYVIDTGVPEVQKYGKEVVSSVGEALEKTMQ